MKKIFLSIMLAAGIFGLAIGQQSHQSSSSKTGQQSHQSSSSKTGSSVSKGNSSASLNKNWEKIGEKTVTLSENHGIFNWNTDREKSINANEMYSAIKFKAVDNPVDLTNVEVQYDNGKKQDISLNSSLKANGESKVVNLNNKEKLDKITFDFKKENTSKTEKAKVELWGLKAGSASGMGQGSSQSGSDKDDQSGSDHKTSKTVTEHSSSQTGSERK